MGIEIAFLIALFITLLLTLFVATLPTLNKSLIGSEFVGLMVGIRPNRLDLFDRGILNGRIFRGLWGLGRIKRGDLPAKW
jgi:hypothetical protein